MTTSVALSTERNYKKLPLSKNYYDLKDQGKHTASKKIAKKTLASASTPASSSSLSSNLSSSISSNSSFISQSSVSKVSKSILSKELDSGLKAVIPLQGQQTSSQLSFSQINVQDNEEVESDRTSTQQLDLHWLKKEQRALLLTLSKEYALDNEIRLYDLLGFHLHTLLEKLKKSIPSGELQEKFDSVVIKEFHQRYLLLYISLRARDKDTTTVKMFHNLHYDNLDENFIIKRADIPSYFSSVGENLTTLLPSLKDKMGTFKQENTRQTQLKAKFLEKNLKLIESQLADIDSSLKLLQAFLINDDRSHSLLSSLLTLPGSESMNKDPQATRNCLVKWIQFINQASLDLAERGIFHFGKYISSEPLEHLPNLITPKLKIERRKHVALHNWYKETLVGIQQDFFAQKCSALTQVIDKHLSYEEYCALGEFTPRGPSLTSHQVISMLFQTCNHADLFCMLGCDFARIMEENIILPLTNGNYISFHEWMSVILENIDRLGNSSCSTPDYEKEPISIPFSKHPGIKQFDKHLQQALTQLMKELTEAFSEESIESAIYDTILLADNHYKNPILNYILLTNLLSTLKPVFEKQQLLFKLQEIRQASLSKLKNKKELSLEDQDVIRAHFLQAMNPFLPYILLMNDTQILSDKRELEITRGERILPENLKDLITFDAEDFPHVQQQPRKKSPDDTPLLPKPQTNPASTLTRKEERELEKLSVREKPREPDVESPEDLRLINKRKDLLSYLKRTGYLPTDSKYRGSHTVLKNPTGKITVVPKGKQDRIAKGTLRAIKRQVQPGKESETTVVQGRAPKAKKKGRRKKLTKTDTIN